MILIPILLGVIGLLLLWAAIVFNLMVRDRNRLREAWSGIDVQLKRRADLVPALVEVVKGYAGHEKKLFTDVAASRSTKQVVEGLRSVLAYVENYPQLKADKNFLDLQKNLSDVEDDLQYARRYYNGTARDYNTRIQSFPSLLLAGPAGFREEKFFEVEYVTERKNPDVAF